MTRAQQPTFDLTVVAELDGVRLHLTGELDFCEVDLLERLVTHVQPGTAMVTLDLTGLRFCDSVGVLTFVALNTAAVSNGSRFQIVNARPAVRRAIEVIDQTRCLNVIDPDPRRSTAA
jgi:anti-anti-sigma factor